MTVKKIGGERKQLARLPTRSEQWWGSNCGATENEVWDYTQGDCRQLDW